MLASVSPKKDVPTKALLRPLPRLYKLPQTDPAHSAECSALDDTTPLLPPNAHIALACHNLAPRAMYHESRPRGRIDRLLRGLAAN